MIESKRSSSTLLEPSEVAKILSVSQRKVMDMGRNGTLPRVKIGQDVRFLQADIEKFIKKNRENGN